MEEKFSRLSTKWLGCPEGTYALKGHEEPEEGERAMR